MISSPHRPTVANINLSAIKENIAQIQEHIKPDTLTYAVVKANAYGHGAVQVARAIESQVQGFCVSNLDEALELREAGILSPILILGVVMPEEVSLAINFNITLTVASLEWVDLAMKERINFKKLTVHLKLDSGMGRIGFRDITELNHAYQQLKDLGVNIEGAFTHFATADEADDYYFNQQYQVFQNLVDSLEERPEIVHASNSATTLWHSDTILNAVRLGVVMYGLNPSGRALDLPYEIKPALSLQSEIVHVKVMEEGDCIGYGATYQATDGECIATLPIGYADGWIRHLSGFSVLVDGQYCPIVGRVSMDQITIRLPKYYPIGTKVTLIGQDGQHEITATDVADKADTINYEVVCLLSDRIPRHYD